MDDRREVHTVENDMLEAYTTLGFVLAHTERVKLLTVVTAADHRQPGWLAKAITTLDVHSGGRAVLGIGVVRVSIQMQHSVSHWAPSVRSVSRSTLLRRRATKALKN